MPIPMYVLHDDLTEALRPLCDLLGTSVDNFYEVPGMTIGHDCITFTVPAGHEADPAGRAPGPVALAHPQGNPHGELAYVVRVEVIKGRVIDDA